MSRIVDLAFTCNRHAHLHTFMQIPQIFPNINQENVYTRASYFTGFIKLYMKSFLLYFYLSRTGHKTYMCNELGDLGVGWDPNRPTTAIQVFQRTQTQSSDGIMIS